MTTSPPLWAKVVGGFLFAVFAAILCMIVILVVGLLLLGVGFVWTAVLR